MPYLGSTVFVASLALALFAGLTGFFLVARSLAPRFVERAERAATTQPLASAGLGVPVALVLVTLAAALSNAGNGLLRVTGILLAASGLAFALAGVAGVAARIGAGLPSPADAERPWLRTVRGAVVVELATLVPLLGWFVVGPALLLVGTGAATLALLRDPSRAPTPAVHVHATSEVTRVDPA